MTVRINHIAWIFIICVLLAGSEARSWGVLIDFDPGNPKRKNHLIDKAVNKGLITYCILNEAVNEYDTASMETQLRKALSLWTSALRQYTKAEVKLERMDCSPGTQDLKLRIGPSSVPYLNFTGVEANGMTIVINSGLEIRNTEDVSDTTLYRATDFKTFLLRGHSLVETMDLISSLKPMDVEGYSKTSGYEYYRVYVSTYVMLIHEVGHAFGLCDTYGDAFDKRCSKNHRSSRDVASQPVSVMSSSEIFYLTEDDLGGLEMLYYIAKGISP
jgi:hypothetical protein